MAVTSIRLESVINSLQICQHGLCHNNGETRDLTLKTTEYSADRRLDRISHYGGMARIRRYDQTGRHA